MPHSRYLALDIATFDFFSGLFGREERVQRYVNKQGVPYRCRCNSTYTGNECCGSQDGMVWLDNEDSKFYRTVNQESERVFGLLIELESLFLFSCDNFGRRHALGPLSERPPRENIPRISPP